MEGVNSEVNDCFSSDLSVRTVYLLYWCSLFTQDEQVIFRDMCLIMFLRWKCDVLFSNAFGLQQVHDLVKGAFLGTDNRSQGKVMHSEECIILSSEVERQIPSPSWWRPPWYWHLVAAIAAVSMHPTGTLFCFEPVSEQSRYYGKSINFIS